MIYFIFQSLASSSISAKLPGLADEANCYLGKVTAGGLGKLNIILDELRTYARSKGWYPSKTVYNKWVKGAKKRLRFCKSGRPNLKELYAKHYMRRQG